MHFPAYMFLISDDDNKNYKQQKNYNKSELNSHTLDQAQNAEHSVQFHKYVCRLYAKFYEEKDLRILEMYKI